MHGLGRAGRTGIRRPRGELPHLQPALNHPEPREKHNRARAVVLLVCPDGKIGAECRILSVPFVILG
ncbi:hypothetical protein GCM10027445_02910 [Amycolatopsis endophytica]